MDPRFPIIESFVDVTYRGLEVGKRAKLTEVAPDAGYVEVAAPMPVGTTVQLATDDGIAITAEVKNVHEQVGGTERPPGMRIAPRLVGAAATWWAQRVTVIATAPPPIRRTKEMTALDSAAAKAVAERAQAESGAPPLGARKTRIMAEGEIKAALSAAMAEEQKLGIARATTLTDAVPPFPTEDGLVDDGKKTEEMSSVDPEVLARLMGGGDPPIVDDGKRTVVMDTVVVDEETLGENGDPVDDDDGGDEDGVVVEEVKPTPSGRMQAVKVKRGKRKKRR